jgi:hypothetical protein
MNYRDRLDKVKEMHFALDREIAELEKTNPTSESIQTKKKQKLALKDEMRQLERKIWEDDHESVRFDDDR